MQSIAANITARSVVNLVSAVSGGEAAGTGIIISSSGLALTNNHVVASSTEMQAELNGNGEYHPVKVLGYDIEHDVALVQIEGVSDLPVASLGDSSSVQVGDAIVALGNAGGKGGDPTVVSGSVTGTDQQITASDQDGSNAETLRGLVQIDANIQPGDSGGPLVDADGKVVGMNAAASSGNGGFGFGGQSANEGFTRSRSRTRFAIAKKILSSPVTAATPSTSVPTPRSWVSRSAMTARPTATAIPRAATATSVAPPARAARPATAPTCRTCAVPVRVPTTPASRPAPPSPASMAPR